MSTIHWINSAGGDWNVGTNWSTGTVPGAGDDAAIDAAGTYTVTVDVAEAAHSLTLADAGATVQVKNALTIGTTLGLTAGVFDLTATGTLVGGTIIGGGLVLQGGTLAGVTRAGTLDLSATNAKATVTNGITLTGTSGTGPGQVLLTGYKSGLYFAGTETLDNAAVSIGNRYAYAPLSESGGVLTLGTNLAIAQTGTYASLYSAPGATIANNGAITAGFSGGRFQIGGSGGFTNQGSIAVSSGDSMVVNQGVAFSNRGTISLAGGATLHLQDNLTTTALGAVANTGGTLFIDGTLDNTGAVLATGTPGLGTIALSGTVNGGTITGSSMLFTGTAAKLTGVDYQGTLDLSAPMADLTINNGITLSGFGGVGQGTVLLTGYRSMLSLSGSTTNLDNAVIDIGHNATYNFSLGPPSLALRVNTGPLTLGTNFLLAHAGRYAQIDSIDAIVNRGSIVAGVSGGQLQVYLGVFGGNLVNFGTIAVTNSDAIVIREGAFANYGMVTVSSGGTLSPTASLVNHGTIRLSDGGTMLLFSNFTPADIGNLINSGGILGVAGTLNNTANYFRTGTAGYGTVALVGTIIRGTVGGGGILFQGGTLSGVTYRGPLNLNGYLTISNGITLTGSNGSGPGQVSLGAGGLLAFAGSQIFDNAGISIAGGVLANLLGGSLTLGPTLVANHTGLGGTIGSKYALGGTSIINHGTINAGYSGGQLTFGAGVFENDGLISIFDDDTLLSYTLLKFILPAEISGVGTIALASGGNLIAVKIDAGQTIDFLDGAGRLQIGTNRSSQGGSFSTVGTVAGTIINFQPGDVLDFGAIGTATSYTYAGGQLSLFVNGTVANQVTLSTTVTSPFFELRSDGSGGTDVTVRSQDPIHWTNTAGGDWNTATNWSPNLIPNGSDDVAIDAAGAYTVTIDSAEAAHSLTLADAGATLQLNNGLTIGSTLELTAGRVDLSSTGTLVGGTIIGSGLMSHGGTLSGVTLDGTLDLAIGASATVTNGITLVGSSGIGPGQVLVESGAKLTVAGTQTFQHAMVGLGGQLSTDLGGALTLGSNVTINQTGSTASLIAPNINFAPSGSIINEGTINAGVRGGSLNISLSYFRNDGYINVSNGDSLSTFTNGFKGTFPSQITGAGTLSVASGGDLITVGIGAGQKIDFLDGTGRLDIRPFYQGTAPTHAGTVEAAILDFQPGDVLDVGFIGAATSYTYSGGTLSLYVNGRVAYQVTLSTVAANPFFSLSDDGSGGTVVETIGTNLRNTAPQDFDGNRVSEILLHSTSDGTFVDWTMSGAAITGAQNLTFNGGAVAVDGSWTVPGTGDFNGDGKTDILLQNTNGSFVDWTMNGAAIASAQNLTFNGAPVGLDSSWWVPGLGDFNGDGKTDILLRHTDGIFVDWTMNGSTITAAANLTFNGATVDPDFSWFVAALGDFDGGATTDILLRNSSSGALVDWAMNGSTIAAADNLTFGGSPVSIDSSWTILGSGDFDGDGKSDILLENNAGAFVDWTMNGATIVSAANVTFQGAAVGLDSSWTFADLGDYNGDGKSDILLRNSSGSLVEWTMNGPTIATAGSLSFNGSPVMIDGSWRT